MNVPLHRTSYHTQIKYLARNGLLSANVLQQIPRSNIHRWKSEPSHKYQSFDLNVQAAHDYNLIKEFAAHRNARRVFSAYVRVIKTALAFAHALPAFHKIIKQHGRQILDLVNKVKSHLGLMRTLRFFDLSVSAFRLWSFQSATECFESLTRSCNRIFPNQLSLPQVTLLKGLLLDPKFQYWPVSSIALHALRENILALSLNTWYKYVHKLGIHRPCSLSRRKKNSVGVRADHPHQLWHADITVFTTADQIKHYIYCVVDNYSRKILTCAAYPSVKVEFRRSTIEDALNKINGLNSFITLITDGGPENDLQSFLDELSQPVAHRKALIEVHYSNSLIEAHNKILKYNYLYRMIVADGDQLNSALPKIVEDFNNRPHISLRGLTPNEAEQNITLDHAKLSNYKQQAALVRKIYNKLNRCKHCTE